MPKRNREGSMIDQPIMEIEANEEVMDIHIYLENEMFQIRKKKRRVWTSKKLFSEEKRVLWEVCNVPAGEGWIPMQRDKWFLLQGRLHNWRQSKVKWIKKKK